MPVIGQSILVKYCVRTPNTRSWSRSSGLSQGNLVSVQALQHYVFQAVLPVRGAIIIVLVLNVYHTGRYGQECRGTNPASGTCGVTWSSHVL
jgi:hypothetical protein